MYLWNKLFLGYLVCLVLKLKWYLNVKLLEKTSLLVPESYRYSDDFIVYMPVHSPLLNGKC